MPGHLPEMRSADKISNKLKAALAALLEAFEYAEDTDSDRWDFAVTIQHLHELGLSETDLRWLVQKRYVEHAREVTVQGDDGRQFRRTGNLTFKRRTCFVLTEVGLLRARSISDSCVVSTGAAQVDHSENGQAFQAPMVHWDAEARKLRVRGRVVKWFKWPAANQEAILNAFQEEGWPERIDDPLPPQPEQAPKRRLADTIKCLNRKQMNQLIHFRGDGTGEGIVWELVEPGAPTDGAD